MGLVATFGGERGIRTLDTLLTYTRFPSVRLQPLGYLSGIDTILPANRKLRTFTLNKMAADYPFSTGSVSTS